MCSAMSEWLNKLIYPHGIKWNELLIYLTTCMNLWEVMLSEKANTKLHIIYIILLKSKIIEMGNKLGFSGFMWSVCGGE